MDSSEQELDREPLISGAETSGANGSLKSSLQKCIPCNCCWPWFTNTDQSEMESTRPEPIEASNNNSRQQQATNTIIKFLRGEVEGPNWKMLRAAVMIRLSLRQSR
ncbi:hypothetical protein R1flu_003275 [Riccia fluitans]|uniref:Uncharacterized protein n=1 Tax=Riccia fluitans TaxID=41844 RepID=A0ABD1Y8K9_9MARC